MMSTQDSFTIPLEISHEQQKIRLLELPPALLELILAENPPSLLLKSMSTKSKDAATSTQHNAVLCTNDQTFNIRQVHSSNSVFLIEPSQHCLDFESGLSCRTGVQAITQCTATLELIPTFIDGTSILKQILPVYNPITNDAERNDNSKDGSISRERFSKETLYENTPLSSYQLDVAWRDTCAFEIHGVAWLPSAVYLARTWKSIISAATRNDLNLAESFSIMDLIEALDEDDIPKGLLNAVITKVAMDKDKTKNLKTIDRDFCVSWIGGVILEAQPSSGNGRLESDFLYDWQDQLPEKWRGAAKLSALKCKYSQQCNGIVKFEPNDLDNSQSSTAPNADGKRLGKWHERFKNTRR